MGRKKPQKLTAAEVLERAQDYADQLEPWNGFAWRAVHAEVLHPDARRVRLPVTWHVTIQLCTADGRPAGIDPNMASVLIDDATRAVTGPA